MKNIRVILVSFVLFTLACMCGSSTFETQPVKVGEVTQSSDNVPAEATTAPAFEIYSVGDIVQTRTLTITLNSAMIQGGILTANFTIENNGTEEEIISTLISFEAKDGDGTEMQEEIFDCGSGSLGGTILPGDKTRGDICFGPIATDTARIYFTPDLFSGQTVVWQVTK